MTSLKPATAVILIFLLAFPRVTATYFQALVQPLRHFSLLASPSEAFQSGFGARDVLPGAAVDAQALAAKHKLAAFFLSDGITKDELIYQRIIEALYPLQPTAESSFIFFKNGENMLAGCDLLDETPAVKLAHCI